MRLTVSLLSDGNEGECVFSLRNLLQLTNSDVNKTSGVVVSCVVLCVVIDVDSIKYCDSYKTVLFLFSSEYNNMKHVSVLQFMLLNFQYNN